MHGKCDRCVWFDRHAGKMVCVAFPAGIPEEIVTGQESHVKPRHDDHGYQFKPVGDGTSPVPVVGEDELNQVTQ